jgi:aminomethyltransferase
MLIKTVLHAEHVALNARMVDFGGFDMPVQYEGIIAEHNWCRENAGIFDVSHMGQVWLHGENVAECLEKLVPADIQGIAPGQQRYSQFINEKGGIIDDLMITRPLAGTSLFLVVNAGCKEGDVAHMRAKLPLGIKIETQFEKGLIALQGQKAHLVMQKLVPEALKLTFMQAQEFMWNGVMLHISRSGYTGEDGFEISVPEAHAVALWRALLADPLVKPIGLGARDSLRLEAGLCLYGHDIDETTTPIEAGLLWSIQKNRRPDGGFPKPARRLVAFDIEGKMPVREGAIIMAGEREIGKITSGGFSPTLNKPIAIGYISSDDTEVTLIVRGKAINAKVQKMPFVPHRYYRGVA